MHAQSFARKFENGPTVKVKKLVFIAFASLILGPWRPALHAQNASPKDICQRPSAGAVVPEPVDLRSRNGVLRVDLTIHNYTEADGSTRYCYLDRNGDESPNLRLKPGDLLILHLKDDLQDTNVAAAQSNAAMRAEMHAEKSGDPCAGGPMTATSTNLHFHGLTVPPVCHQDDVLKTLINPKDPPFEYRFRIPQNEPPGLYWYHPHVHGFTKVQVLGGASGALIVEGIERADNAVAGLPERVLVVRDQDLLNPNAPPSKSEPVVPRMLFDRDGDAANTGTGFGKPAKDLSINFVPVPYPDYPPASIKMRPGERQLWRVLNASAITYLNLQVLFNNAPQPLGLVALDGVPLNENGAPGDFVDWQTHLGVPPGARVEFIVQGPPAGVSGLFVTRSVDTGPGGENDPNRALATITASADAPEPRSTLAASPEPLPRSKLPWLGSVAPVITRKLYFSEKLDDPNNPNSATQFYITVDGQTPKAFDPASAVPNIIARQGTVEDWIIENRSSELHAFHIHQLHFMLLDYMGVPVNEPFLRDTVNVPYYNGKTLVYPSVRLRMDFRDPNIVGTFVYHCHLLEHEDNGMMGVIRVDPADGATHEGSNRGSARRSAKLSARATPRLCGATAQSADRGN
ncbi:MAG TPA: multicopper oxidase domain-containing protein [Candidatus Baltobacteraceae bacterium]|nr:multicopper oxidase domain-containing protein [Candidatus Baltobacteraceae bacterium]